MRASYTGDGAAPGKVGIRRARDARRCSQVIAAVIGAGRGPRLGAADLMIASTAIVAGLPLYTTNPGDVAGSMTR
jgi:predicted nucleic acid-binding protein